MRIARTVRQAGPPDVEGVGRVLADAFQDDPVFSWVLPDPEQRRRRLPGFFRALVAHVHLRHDLIFTTNDLAGAAVWDPPGRWKLGIIGQLRLAPMMVSALGRRLPALMSLLSTFQRKHLREPHYYLFAIGTDTRFQGQGVGTSLMEPVLARCDAERSAAYLECSNERNLPLYRRHRFEITEEVVMPDGPTVWLMRRPPLSSED